MARPLNETVLVLVFRSVSLDWDFTTVYVRALLFIYSHMTLFQNTMFNSNGMLDC